MAPSSRKRSGAPTRGLGRGSGGNNIFDHIYKDNAPVDVNTTIAGVLGVPRDVIERLKDAIEDAFDGHAAELVHIASFIVNYRDAEPFNTFVGLLTANKRDLLQRLRMPKYIVKKLQKMVEGGCRFLWGDRYVELDEGACYELLYLTALALYTVVRYHTTHGVWRVIEEGSDVGDVVIDFAGDEHE
jgi:hypothetical protein